ncbi:phospholipid-transporting ATPase ABCA3-like [Battus philenor]|uniref:phospholipid-transporting ATPase ABCA3-like n=1 Tax=Battus philenor TaxID=42288 RepID=UPI0035CEDC41
MRGTLRVLMLKHLVVRARRFVNTGVELISPAVFFIILFLFKDFIISPMPKHHRSEIQIYNPEPMPLDSITGPTLVFYTPDTKLAAELMDGVGERLKLTRLKSFPIGLMSKGYYPVSDVADIAQYMDDLNGNQALVVFQDMVSDLPKHLNYTIRIKKNFMTNLYNPLDGTLEPHLSFGTIYETFMRLQWAIDTSYQKLKTGVDVKQNVTLQEFPFVKKNGNVNPVIASLADPLMVLCWLSLLLVFVFLMSRLLDERTTGIEELIKMSGVSRYMLQLSHFLNVVPTGLVYCIVNAALLTVTSNPILPHSNPVLIAIVLALHFISLITMAFASSYLIKNSQYVVTMSMFVYIALWIPMRVFNVHRPPRTLLPFAGLAPHMPLLMFWEELIALEQYGHGMTFANMFTRHGQHSASALLCLLLLVLQILIFALLTWYLALVNPGPYGQALPWTFVFQRQYWSQQKVTPQVEAEALADPISHDPLYFEEAPKDLETGIQIINITKVFPKQVTLSNVSLNIYKGEITVLLGHNGAGKTTLMNIITGMLSATSGKVYVEGLDTVSEQDEVRKLLGLCPQHNLFFPDLTVQEHILFFTMLKGYSYKKAKVECKQLLEKLGLWEKKSAKSGQLSGGMKRRLQLGCALAGGSRVLILDEPTSGLDVETRRELWDLLLSLRGSRTVLLTTHFMEEADVLGDRVAALHAGQLRCHATTMHLKRALGTGYRLSFTTIGIPKEENITRCIRSVVADAGVREKSLNSITYNLPAKDTSSFPALFKVLEAKRSELAIDSIGVGISTLEEVFLKLCSDVDTTFTEDAVDAASPEATHMNVTGGRLIWRQMQVLLKRQLMYMWSRKWSVLILQIIIPILTLIMFTYITVEVHEDKKSTSAAAMDLNLYSDMADVRVLYNINGSGVTMRSLEQRYSNVEFEPTNDVVASLLEYGNKDIMEYNKYVVGIELNDTDAKVLFTTRIRHAAPVALGLLANAVGSRHSIWGDGDSVTTHNLPLPYNRDDSALDANLVQPKSIILAVMWSTAVTFVVLATSINLVSLPCKERRSGARHAHVLAGCLPAIHWGCTLLAHAAVCTLTLLVPTVIAAAVLDDDRTFTQPDFLGVIFFVLLLGSLAFFGVMYLVSFFFGERGSSTLLFGCLIIFGLFTSSIKQASDLFEKKDFTYYLVTVIGYIAPPHTLRVAATKAANVARLNSYCLLNRRKCPTLFVPESGFDAEACCQLNKNPRCYFCIDEYSPGSYMIILFFQFIIYMTLVVLMQHGVFNRLADRLFNQRYRPPPAPAADDMVRAEKTYVSKAITLPPDQIQEAMLVDDVHKNYIQIIKKSCNAVKGVSFSVKKGECFGLLGVNGAGKTTTFKMLNGEQCPTRGTVFANGQHIDKNRGKYLHSLGYCPQFFGLDEFLSGYDNLALVLTLRGLSAEDVDREVNSWIEVVGLEQYATRAVRSYSGGMARRLAAGAALCGGAAVALLDEPTAGVDVAARRRVWAALRRNLAARRATLVTSHSMDEMEALCSRIAIMSHGRIRALGSAAALRAAHAAGHAVQLKLRHATDVTDGGKSDVERLKSQLHQKFNCDLKDEHKTMLHYHINDTTRYSELFTELEALKKSNPIVEDYSVSETTLEEVFLSFAKETEDQYTQVTPV